MPARVCLRALASLALCCATLAPVRAQDASSDADIERPFAARRVVHFFDFEEREYNAEDAPRYWYRAQDAPGIRDREGFPQWNKAAFTTARRYSGEHSVVLPTSGGSTSLRLSPGVIAALPGADYVITAQVRTEGVSRAAARLVARFLDENRKPIPGFESSSEILRSANEWTQVSAELRGDAPAAAWIQIDIELLQPREAAEAQRIMLGHGEHTQDDPVAKQRAWLEDVSGAAYFDDVAIYQLPRIDLKTGSPGAITAAPDQPQLLAHVRDLTGEALTATIVVRDWRGERIAQGVFPLPPGGDQIVFEPALPGFGWFTAFMTIQGPTGLVARAGLDFLYLPEPLPRPASESQRFSLIAERLPERELDSLAPIVETTGVGAVQLAVLDRSITSARVRPFAQRVDPVVQRLLDLNTQVTFSITGVPEELAQILQIDVREPLELLGRVTPLGALPPWSLYLNTILDRFGQRVSRWQIGATGESSVFWREGLAEELDNVRGALGRLVPGVEVASPWGAEQSLDSRIVGRGTITVTLPASISEDAIPGYIEYWNDRIDATVVLEPPDHRVYGRESSAVALARRAVAAWRAGAKTLAIAEPWAWEGPRGEQLSPAPTLAVWRQMVERLGGRRVVGQVPAQSGVRAYILRGASRSAIVAWNDSAPEDRAHLRMFLGDGRITSVDIFGNESTVPLVQGEHTIPLTDAPVFIEGIDVNLALFRAGFSVDPPFVPAEATVHPLDIRLRNPWPMAISGRVRIAEPSQWKIEPRILAFSIPAGGEQRLPVEASFGLAEEAGPRTVVAEVELNAGEQYPVLRLHAPIELGLSTLQMTPTYSFIPDASGQMRDLALTISIVNEGDAAVTLQSFALAPGYPREQAPVSALGPGQSVVLRFTYADGARRLLGSRIRVGVIEVGGTGRLNKSVTIE